MKVMFVCHANVGRSQAAEAFFARASKHEASSSGTHVDELMAKEKPASAKMKDNSKLSLPYMLKQGIDISEKERTQITPELVAGVDRVIAILTPEEVPDYVKESGKLTMWDISDPATHVARANELFDEIKILVDELVQEIG
jgi:protein-tyrosine-phosphatase